MSVLEGPTSPSGAKTEPCLECKGQFPREELVAWVPKDSKEWDVWGEP